LIRNQSRYPLDFRDLGVALDEVGHRANAVPRRSGGAGNFRLLCRARGPSATQSAVAAETGTRSSSASSQRNRAPPVDLQFQERLVMHFEPHELLIEDIAVLAQTRSSSMRFAWQQAASGGRA
jgi:hypothetical protein